MSLPTQSRDPETVGIGELRHHAEADETATTIDVIDVDRDHVTAMMTDAMTDATTDVTTDAMIGVMIGVMTEDDRDHRPDIVGGSF